MSSWALMEWSARLFKFVRQIPGGPLQPLITRARLPSVDKISHQSLDVRPLQFLKLLETQPHKAAEFIHKKCGDIHIDDVEEYAHLLLDQDRAPNLRLSEKIIQRLKTYDLWVGFCETRSKADSGAKNKASFSRSQSSTNVCSSVELQQLLDKLELEWLCELEGAKLSAKHLLLDTLNKHLSRQEQCQVVTSYLRAFIERNMPRISPESLTGLSRKLGIVFENQMLGKIAQTHEIKFYHNRSRFLWGLAGLSPWNSKQHIIVGYLWLQTAMKSCKFEFTTMHGKSLRPAFWKTWFVNKTQRRNIMVVNNQLIKELRMLRSTGGTFLPAITLPLDRQPRPWTSFQRTDSESAQNTLSLIASASTEGIETVEESLSSGLCLNQIKGLNRLQSQAWKINHRVVAEISRNGDLEESVQSALTVMGDKPFYIPMYMDFRGRAYSSPQIPFDFLGNDASRSILQFSEPRVLGKEGLKWLSVHLANIVGLCKSQTFQERLLWVEAHRRCIIDSALNPSKERWWQVVSKKPYQTLAACIELSNAWHSENPQEYLSSLPIQLDGTSNGLQHLAAISLDDSIASLVNIKPHTSPEPAVGSTCGDIYSVVGKRMERYMKSKGRNSALQRENIKKAVMTYFYGASQISLTKALEDEANWNNQFSITNSFKVVVAEMFKPQREIQLWLVDCAQRILSSRLATQPSSGPALVWTSPLGLPVVQPYVSTNLMAIRVPNQSFWIPSKYHYPKSESKKQVAAVSANFVHTLDAAHMFLTALSLPRNISFAAIHDSFSTHAGSVSVLNKTLREAFVQIHIVDRIKELRREWQVRYHNRMVLADVYSDSGLYEQLQNNRGKAYKGQNLQFALDAELKEHYHASSTVSYQISPKDVCWSKSKPHIGTPGLPSTQMWVSLELADPPPRGSLKIERVRDSEYFFS